MHFFIMNTSCMDAILSVPILVGCSLRYHKLRGRSLTPYMLHEKSDLHCYRPPLLGRGGETRGHAPLPRMLRYFFISCSTSCFSSSICFCCSFTASMSSGTKSLYDTDL